MIYLLDTNVVTEPIKPNPDFRCMDWLEQNQHESFLTTVSLAELRWGAERLPEGKRKRELLQALQFIWEDFGERLIDFDSSAAFEFGRYVAEFERLHGFAAVNSADVRDLQIGAIARTHGLTVATRNVRHFPCVDSVNPFD